MSGNARRLLEQALLFIDKNLDKHLSVEDIASHAHMSKYHFQRVFSTYQGETISQYVLHRRLEAVAQKLVYQQDMKITDIATSSGFENHSSFSRIFKKHFNLSPREFRRSTTKFELGSDASRPFLKTIASKYKTIDVTVEEQPTLWCNNKQTINQKNDGKGSDGNLRKIKHAYKEILSSNTSKLFGIATHCGLDSHTEPRTLTDDNTLMLYGALYLEKKGDGWSPDWLEIEAGLWAVCVHQGEYEYKYQTLNNVIRSWLPDSGYELRNTMSFEVYRKCPDSEDLDQLITHLYIPIKQSKENMTA